MEGRESSKYMVSCSRCGDRNAKVTEFVDEALEFEHDACHCVWLMKSEESRKDCSVQVQ